MIKKMQKKRQNLEKFCLPSKLSTDNINYTIYLNISTNFFIQTIYHRHRTDDNQKSEVFFTSDLIH